MGGRGSGGGRGGKASAGGGGSAMNKDELIKLYNNISGNPTYSVEQRVNTMASIKKEIDKIDAKEKSKTTQKPKEKKVKEKKKKELTPEEQKKLKAEETKKKRLAALEKARAKRAENIKNGIKNPRKPRQKKNLQLSFDSVGIGDKYKLRDGSKLEIVDMGYDDAYDDNNYVAYKLNGKRYELSQTDFDDMWFRT